MDITAQATERTMYAAGLTAAMLAMARGEHDDAPSAGPSPLVRAYADGYADADDDSDDPRPDDDSDDPRPDDEDALRAVAALVYQELERIDADVSAWPEYATGRIRMVDDIVDDVYEPEALLAVLRGVETAAGTDAMWSAAMQARARA